jgi:hypothetical protein
VTNVERIEVELRQIGYAEVVADYTFADLWAPDDLERSVALAAFTESPASYRNAAFGVVTCQEDAEIVNYRALGAPLLFSVSEDVVKVWRVRSGGPPQILGQHRPEDVPRLFQEQADRWAPLAIHRAKFLGDIDKRYQLDFVDLGLMVAIEGEVHTKLDRLLRNVMGKMVGRGATTIREEDYRAVFQNTFRLLAAKVLSDRHHQLANTWDPHDVGSVVAQIGRYYGLEPKGRQVRLGGDALANAWQELQGAISFRNISVDDLAFIYENTLITPETRRRLSTHGTPRQVAEYIVTHARLDTLSPSQLKRLRIFEPFCGAAVFLVSALRHVRSLLPQDWTPEDRHRFLRERLRGAEIDALACEVATLSLVLADYPNANGWKISPVNLFEDARLTGELKGSNVVFCNPPYSDFEEDERQDYPQVAARSVRKPAAILETVLDAKPWSLGFVLPRNALFGTQYADARKRLESTYGQIEVVALPDRIFPFSKIETALLIANGLRLGKKLSGTTRLTTRAVRDDGRERFLTSGEVSATRTMVRPFPSSKTGELFIPALEELWRYLKPLPQLSEMAWAHRGLEWNYPQAQATRSKQEPGFEPGVYSSGDLRQMGIVTTQYLDRREESQKYKAYLLPWERPKVLMNAVRITRGPWRVAACPDRTGLLASQQLFGVWLREEAESKWTVESLAVLLNHPLANAYLENRCPDNRMRIGALAELPVPAAIDTQRLDELASRYLTMLDEWRRKAILRKPGLETDLERLLVEMDAVVLQGYDLPPRLERRLLDYFSGLKRPSFHQFRGWYPESLRPAIPLHEIVDGTYRAVAGNWLQKVFTPLPEHLSKKLDDYLD